MTTNIHTRRTLQSTMFLIKQNHLTNFKNNLGYIVPITACTVVQVVVKATSQSNGKGQILTPWGSETLERISMKLGIYNRVAGMPTHANPCGAATTWVVWTNT